MSGLAQDAVDYGNEAQQRVAADTRALLKQTPLLVSDGVAEYTLPSDVILIAALLDPNGVEVPFSGFDEALRWKSTALPVALSSSHYRLGHLIGLIPTPTEDATYTLFYYARPAPLLSDSSFEITGDYELLIDHLIQSMKLSDDGQPELAAAELSFYRAEAPIMKRRAQREDPPMFTSA